MKITPVRYRLVTEISSERKIIYYYDLNRYETIAELEFPEWTDINLYEIAKCIAECLQEKELKATTIKFKFHENEIQIYNLKEITERDILEMISHQIK